MTAHTFPREGFNDSSTDQHWATNLEGMNAYLRLRTNPDLGGYNGKLVLSVPEAAEILGIGRSAAYEACRTGEIPSRRIGRRVVIPVPQLLAWLNGSS